MAIKVAIFDDVLAARNEVFHIPGLEVDVYGHADDVLAVCAEDPPPGVVCMDYSMGEEHANGADAIRALRAQGYRGRIVATTSDPVARERMVEAGADEALVQKALLRSFLLALGRGEEKGS